MDIILTINGEQVYVDTVKAPDDCLTEYQWELLREAEELLYRTQPGCHAYTDVMCRDQSSELVPLWDTAVSGVEAVDIECHPEQWIDRQAARRVAQAMMLINFGAEMLLK